MPRGGAYGEGEGEVGWGRGGFGGALGEVGRLWSGCRIPYVGVESHPPPPVVWVGVKWTGVAWG